jgi:hypothetical protein
VTHFPPPLTAAEVAELDAAILNKRRRHEMAAWEKALADNANKQHRNEANKQRHHKSSTWEKVLADDACEQLCQESADRTVTSTTSALVATRTAVLADLAFPKPALAKDKRRKEETAKKQRRADDEHVMAPVLLPDPGNAAIRRIWVECALLATPLGVILAEIECNNIAQEARAPPMSTSPHPAAMLSTPPPPYDFRGRGPFYDGG